MKYIILFISLLLALIRALNRAKMICHQYTVGLIDQPTNNLTKLSFNIMLYAGNLANRLNNLKLSYELYYNYAFYKICCELMFKHHYNLKK